MNLFLPIVEKLPNGHPVQIYYKESTLIQRLLEELENVNPKDEFQKYFNIFNQLITIEKRFVRKENQLFPYLEKHGWNGPSKGMWSFHDNLREQIKFLNTHNKELNFSKINENLPYLIQGIRNLLTIEDSRLFPNAMELLTKEDWEEFYEGDEEIGWMLTKKPPRYPEIKESYIHPSQDFTERDLSFSTKESFRRRLYDP